VEDAITIAGRIVHLAPHLERNNRWGPDARSESPIELSNEHPQRPMAVSDSRQSALDGQVTPESIEHYVNRVQDCVGSLPRNDLKPLKIFKHGAHRPDRCLSGAAGGPTMTQETIQVASF